MGADVQAWYDEMPKAFRADVVEPAILSPKKGSASDVSLGARPKIDSHFRNSQCLVCDILTSEGRLLRQN